MPTLAPELRTETTTAERLARQFWETNRRALRKTQPAVAELLNDVELNVEWVVARDGSLSALENGKWWADCSVPLLAGRSLLKTLADEPVGSCQLAPFHAGLVRASRERMGFCPVLFVAQPDVRVAKMILSCHDFSDQIERHRFWIVTGTEWLAQLEQMFNENPGLATPLRFIRTRLTPEEITLPMITGIQAVFSKVLSARSDIVARLQSEPIIHASSKKILLVGGREFRLWNFGTRAIEQQLSGRIKTDGLSIDRFDMDHALCGSPLALLHAARECGALVSADVCRADCNQLISADIPWITWMTQAGAPPFETAGPRDALILADEKWKPIARVAGWPANRIRVCGWPSLATPVLRYAEEPGRTPQKSLGFICDTRKISIPASVADFSSHRLLWELIEEELAANPLAVEAVDAYLSNRAGQLNIATDVLDAPKFVDELIIPAYQQGLARLLIGAGIPLRLWGNGWADLPEFTPHVAGAICDQSEFDRAITQSLGLIYAWPTRAAHAIDMTGKPVVHRSGPDRAALIRAAQKVLATPSNLTSSATTAQLGRTILELLL